MSRRPLVMKAGFLVVLGSSVFLKQLRIFKFIIDIMNLVV